MNTRRFELRNDFHNSSISVVASGRDEYFLSKSQWQKAKKSLCGILSCHCPKVSNYFMVELSDGGAEIFVPYQR